MNVELDHLFVCVDVYAPEAERVVEFGLCEGSPNQHDGQGTANRRFFFANAMIEMVFVDNAAEAQSAEIDRTRLWERWSGRRSGASPFGICLRPAGLPGVDPPFPGWAYRPRYLPPGLAMHIGEAGLEEPMWVYLGFARGDARRQFFGEHPIGVREITGLELTSPTPLRSAAARIVVDGGILSTREGAEHLLEIEFDHRQRKAVADFRPGLPLVFRF